MKKYFSFFSLRFVMGLQYRAAAWAGVATQFVWGGMMIAMYQAFYQTEPEQFPMTFEATVSYIWFQQAFLALFAAWMLEAEIFESIKDGNIAYELCRPMKIYPMLFARAAGARVEICHTTITQGAELLKKAKMEGAAVYVETCPHYLIFDHQILREKKSFAKCTPPFRSRENVEGMWEYVKDGTIDVLGSDHGPFTDEEKVAKKDFWKENCGFGCNDVMLAAMVSEGVHKRGLSWSRLTQLTSANAAKMLGIYPRKGSLMPGADADMIFIDPELLWTYDGSKVLLQDENRKGTVSGHGA